MSTKKTTYILDTNVLLSDPNAINSYEEHDIVLPFVVIEELDRHKDRLDEVGRNARETSRKLSLMFADNTNQLKVGTGGILTVMSINQAMGNRKTPYEMPEELKDSKGDNIIIKFCKEYVDTHSTTTRVVLVTRDILLRLKAKVLGIEVEDYKKISSGVKSEDVLYSGITKLDYLSSDQMIQFFEGNLVLEKEVVENVKLYPNEFLILTDGDKSGLAKFVDVDKPLKKIEATKYSPFKINSRNKEQTFAIDLLMDPTVQLVTIAGIAGSRQNTDFNCCWFGTGFG